MLGNCFWCVNQFRRSLILFDSPNSLGRTSQFGVFGSLLLLLLKQHSVQELGRVLLLGTGLIIA